MGKERNLAMMLVDQGYDVWITNSRGNIHSYEHMHPETHNVFFPNSPFFNFTFDQMAKYDIISNINFIKAQTQHEKVIYIGHS